MTAGPDFNAAAKAPITPEDVSIFQSIAAHGTKQSLAEKLQEFGPDIMRQADRDGRNAFLKAAETCHTPTMALMLAAGMEVDTRDAKGNTALMIVAYKGYKSAAEWLISKGADVNASNKAGQTVLMLAGLHKDNRDRKSPMSQKKQETIALVLEKGADIDAKDARGQTALQQAEALNHMPAKRLILQEQAARDARKAAQAAAVEDLCHSLTVRGTAQNIQPKPIRFRPTI